VLGALIGLPALLQQLDLISFGIPPKVRASMLLASVVAVWITPILNRAAAEASGKNVQAQVQAVEDKTAVAQDTADKAVSAVGRMPLR
jgi:uncharacterized membrane protein